KTFPRRGGNLHTNPVCGFAGWQFTHKFLRKARGDTGNCAIRAPRGVGYHVEIPWRTPMALQSHDLYDVRSLLSDEERAVQDSVARFTDERVLPIIGECFDQGRFPAELIPEIAGLGLLGATLPPEYGGAGLN